MPRSGITYDAELEWVLAARWAGYTWDKFRNLEGEKQSFLVAAYRVANQIDSLLAHEQVRAARSRLRQTGAPSRPRRRR